MLLREGERRKEERFEEEEVSQKSSSGLTHLLPVSLGAAQSYILVPGALRLGTGVGVYTKCPPGGALAKGRTPGGPRRNLAVLPWEVRLGTRTVYLYGTLVHVHTQAVQTCV